jgi:hypothetical protein
VNLRILEAIAGLSLERSGSVEGNEGVRLVVVRK